MEININDIINILRSNVNNWLPAVTSVISVIICVFVGFAKIKRACNDIKSDKTIKELRSEVENDLANNREVVRLLKRILDENHKIKRGSDDEGPSSDRS